MGILIVTFSLLSQSIHSVQYLSSLLGAAHVLYATARKYNLSKYENLDYSWPALM
jgi:hypothetical protein